MTNQERIELTAGETLFNDFDRNLADFEKGWNEALRFTIGLINEAIAHNHYIMGQASLAELRTTLKTHLGDAS